MGKGIAVDATGIFVAGYTYSTNFPLAVPRQLSGAGDFDAFVMKLDPTGTSLIYSTYLGGGASDVANALAIDGAGNAYVTGTTSSNNFPTVAPIYPNRAGGNDAFVAKLNPAGQCVRDEDQCPGFGPRLLDLSRWRRSTSDRRNSRRRLGL